MRFLLAVTGLVLAAGVAPAAEPACQAWLPKPRTAAKGQAVGPKSCALLETDASLDGLALKRLDIGLDGTVDGWVTEGTGDYSDYLTNAPDVAFGNTADPGPVFHAVAEYERAKGAAMTLVFPADPRKWNGRLWVTAHGRGRSVKSGNLRAWDKNVDPANPTADLNRYDKLMLAKGYALAKTHRTTEEGVGEIKATLENGTVSMNKAFNDSAHYVMDFTRVAENALRQRLGRAPARTYFYGHSAGARIGRGLNYTPGLNLDADGKPFYDAILADDPAAGTWLPVVVRDGKDVLFATEAEKKGFVPQLEVWHQGYNNVWETGSKLPFMSISYLENKRRNGKILRDKGLADRYRAYEVRGISHSGGENMPTGEKGDVKILQLAHAMDRFVDILDAWADRGVVPPATRTDWAELGDVDADGVVENHALAFPEVACPLGVYYAHPPSAPNAMNLTSWAAFDGQGLEPRDGKGNFVDMNRNGVWDFKETPAQAWRRLGMLGPKEDLTRERYVSCVTRATGRLRDDGFFSAATAERYALEAAKTPLP